jgi:hypothetical protein
MLANSLVVFCSEQGVMEGAPRQISTELENTTFRGVESRDR